MKRDGNHRIDKHECACLFFNLSIYAWLAFRYEAIIEYGDFCSGMRTRLSSNMANSLGCDFRKSQSLIIRDSRSSRRMLSVSDFALSFRYWKSSSWKESMLHFHVTLLFRDISFMAFRIMFCNNSSWIILG